ncbi:MAG: hypothetical protein QM270_00700 [Bacillota bacterium]|nr:hypothetical protein [Bacillota bacterium]
MFCIPQNSVFSGNEPFSCDLMSLYLIAGKSGSGSGVIALTMSMEAN